MERTRFLNLSPLDHRYYIANSSLFESLSRFISEEGATRYCIKAEIALVKAHLSFSGEDDPDLFDRLDSTADLICCEEIYAEEEKTQHNIRALVNVLTRHLPAEIRPYVHLGATSADILDTASSMRYRDAMREVVLPLLAELMRLLIGLSRKHADTPQIGRTHGQHAVPITFGFALASYVSRLGQCVLEIEKRTGELTGKLAGAVGSYNATSMIVPDPEELERKYLDQCGLSPCELSTQLVQPEPLLRLLAELAAAFGVLANLADDLRHLQRSEIREVREEFTGDQVGSSTMPQKRNPWNSEHVKSLWKAYIPRVMTFYMDQISEHQRDLTNSASSRFIAEFIAGFCAALNRTKKVLSRLFVDTESMERNLQGSGDLALAEAAYILLSVSGIPEGHEEIRKLTLLCEREGRSLVDELKNRPPLWKAVQDGLHRTVGMEADLFFSNPALYCGLACRKAISISDRYERLIMEMEERLNEH